MFDKDYFSQEETTGPGAYGRWVGTAGAWGLHLAKVAFLIYSGYHGISASANYAGTSEPARVAQMLGIIVVEMTLFSLYLAWHNQKITGVAQSVVAGLTYAIGFTLACLGIVVDSQLHAGGGLSGWLAGYLAWGLPIAPAIMALGALLTHELAPEQLRARKQSNEQQAFAEAQFTAYMASQRAEMEAAKMVKNLQLNARASAAKQIAAWYASDDAQQAISSTAMQNAPALLRAIGIHVEGDDAPANGRVIDNQNEQTAVSVSSLADAQEQPKQEPDAFQAWLDDAQQNGRSKPLPGETWRDTMKRERLENEAAKTAILAQATADESGNGHTAVNPTPTEPDTGLGNQTA